MNKAVHGLILRLYSDPNPARRTRENQPFHRPRPASHIQPQRIPQSSDTPKYKEICATPADLDTCYSKPPACPISWDIAPDGKRYLIISDNAQGPSSLNLLQNWRPDLAK